MIDVIPWEGQPSSWNALALGDPEASFSHLAAWRDVVTDSLGHECLYWAAVDEGGGLEGLLPLVRVRSAYFGHYLVSMPFLNAGGPLGTPRARAALVARATEEARRSRADLLELRTRGVPPHGLTVSTRKITHTLELPPSSEALWSALPSKVRSQVKRPMKEGLEVRSGLDQVDPFYEVFARHMRILGTPVMPREWFRAIVANFPSEVVIVAVYDRSTPVAAGCGFSWRGSCEITWASALREWSRLAPNMLLYWAFLQEAVARGATTFDFGRCTPGSTTHSFKRQWGGEDIPLAWGQWRAGEVAATPSPDRGIYRLATACWRRLPLAMTNRLGPRVARWIP